MFDRCPLIERSDRLVSESVVCVFFLPGVLLRGVLRTCGANDIVWCPSSLRYRFVYGAIPTGAVCECMLPLHTMLLDDWILTLLSLQSNVWPRFPLLCSLHAVTISRGSYCAASTAASVSTLSI
jgi:hypothetical protein